MNVARGDDRGCFVPVGADGTRGSAPGQNSGFLSSDGKYLLTTHNKVFGFHEFKKDMSTKNPLKIEPGSVAAMIPGTSRTVLALNDYAKRIYNDFEIYDFSKRKRIALIRTGTPENQSYSIRPSGV